MSNLTEIDRLIEEGLTLYGCGDLDGALLVWEKALAIEPDNAQATSYVDYVRANYDLLTREVEEQTDPAPFGIDDEPYQVEITTPDLAPMSGPPPVKISDVDSGWFMDGDDEPRRPQQPASSLGTLTIEIDEPPPPQGVEFDDATREYQKDTAAKLQKASLALSEPASEFGADTTPGFGSGPEITPGFGPSSQTTDVRNRELGFVQPTAAKPDRAKRPSQVPAEIQMTLRSPGEPLTLAGEIGLAFDDKAATSGGTANPVELLESLPLPNPTSPLLGKAGAPSSRDTATRDLPLPMRTPAQESKAPPLAGEPPRSPTRDFSAQKTTELPSRPTLPGEGPLIHAPTRDLGIRAAATTPRPAAGTPATRPRPVDEGTRADVILPFDPIDARAAQILDDIDAESTGAEPKEDQTRRRITRLFEKAGEWSRAGELDKAVAAIDLAMSEDPNSALAQKLIQRHRETTMQVFQAFLGDLQRTPALARPLHELANAPISPRAAFLLSRVDGTMSIDEILDVSGMPRIEAYRYLCQLFLRGILR